MVDLHAPLKRFFGYSTFRPLQEDVCRSLIAGQDTLVVMATGSGKSVCYQIPPVAVGKCCVVISPLISLMADQIAALTPKGIRATELGPRGADYHQIVQGGKFDLVYMSPERALLEMGNGGGAFWRKMWENGLSMVAIDEAHCVSEWGHDFRSSYRRLAELRPLLPGVPFCALTATATPQVRQDIASSLRFGSTANTFVSTFDRPNITYRAKLIGDMTRMAQDVANAWRREGGSVVVYCSTKKDVDRMATELRDAVGFELRGRVARYHAGMTEPERTEAHAAFSGDRAQLMAATVAYGMGIDKRDIRRVYHYGQPKSLESYYQESGRAGRDGLPAAATLCWSQSDREFFYTQNVESQRARENLQAGMAAMRKYCNASTCRRAFLLRHFGEDPPRATCGNCDNCLGEVETRVEAELSGDARLLISAVQQTGECFGLGMPIKVVRGSCAKDVLNRNFHERCSCYGLGKHHSDGWWNGLANILHDQGFLRSYAKEKFKLYGVADRGRELVKDGAATLFIVPSVQMQEEDKAKARRSSGESRGSFSGAAGAAAAAEGGGVQLEAFPAGSPERAVYEDLVRKRAELAARLRVFAGELVLSEAALRLLVQRRPSAMRRAQADKSQDTLDEVEGVNAWFIRHCGSEVLEALRSSCASRGLALDEARRAARKAEHFALEIAAVEAAEAAYAARKAAEAAAAAGHDAAAAASDALAGAGGAAGPAAPPVQFGGGALELGHPARMGARRLLNAPKDAAKRAYEKFANMGVGVEAIAAEPGRTGKPIKPSTVLGYLADVMGSGEEIISSGTWVRLARASGLTPHMASAVRTCVLSQMAASPQDFGLGSVKRALGEEFDYGHIKVVAAAMATGTELAVPEGVAANPTAPVTGVWGGGGVATVAATSTSWREAQDVAGAHDFGGRGAGTQGRSSWPPGQPGGGGGSGYGAPQNGGRASWPGAAAAAGGGPAGFLMEPEQQPPPKRRVPESFGQGGWGGGAPQGAAGAPWGAYGGGAPGVKPEQPEQPPPPKRRMPASFGPTRRA